MVFPRCPINSKRREGDNLGDGKFSGFQEMGISLNEVFPFLSGDGKFSGFQEMGISLNEVFPFLSGDGKFSGFQEMGISLNEVFPFLSGDGKFSGITKMEMMASLGNFQISILRNDGVARRSHNFTRRINRMA